MIARLRRNSDVRHGFAIFAAVGSANALFYVFYMLVGRVGGVEIYGVVTSLVSAILVCSAPAIVIQLIVARIAGELGVADDLGRLRRLANRASLVVGAGAGSLALLAIFEQASIARFFHLSSATVVVLSAIAFAFTAIVFAQRGVLQGSHRFDDLAASYVIEAAARVLIGVPLVPAYGAVGAMLGLLIGELVTVAHAAWVFHRRFGPPAAALAVDRSALWKTVSGVGLGQLTFTVLSFYDVPVIKHVFDPRQAGLYAAAALAGRAVLAANSFVPLLVMPKVTARAARDEPTFPLLRVALAIAAAIAGIATVACVVQPRLVVALIAGRAFADAGDVVFTYVLASSALSLGNVVAAYQMGLHQYRFVVPSFLACIAEIVAVSTWHPSVEAVVLILCIGHGLVFATTVGSLALKA